MRLLNKLKLNELNQFIHGQFLHGSVIQGLSFHKELIDRKNIAHFCEHDGICINFTRARESWHALAPCALKPWWLFLDPLRKTVKK